MARKDDAPAAPLPPDADELFRDAPPDDAPPEPGEPPEPQPQATAEEPAADSAPLDLDAAIDALKSERPTPLAVGPLTLGPTGEYKILRTLGRGGMAEVAHARRIGPAGFTRDVALKCVTAALSLDDRYRKMFVDEARLASQLTHPNIAQVYDLHQKGNDYLLVLEYVDGTSLRQALEQAHQKGTPFTEGFACYLCAEIADALAYAHSACDHEGKPLGIIHRDVTPHNVMLTRFGNVKLLDFGIAYSLLEGRDATRGSLLKGKSSYMSPEQAEGRPLDGRSDLFSLGLILVELLTLRRVFEKDSEAETLRRVSDADPRLIQAAVETLPPPLISLVGDLLAKDPARRPSTGTELSRTLRSYLASRATAYSATDAVAELGALSALPDVPKHARGATTVARIRRSTSTPRPPVLASSPPLPSPTPPAAAVVANRDLAAIRELIRHPKSPKRRLVVPAIVLGAIIVLGNLAVALFVRVNAPTRRAEPEVVKTPSQQRAEQQAAQKAASASTDAPPTLAPAATLDLAPRPAIAPAATPAAAVASARPTAPLSARARTVAPTPAPPDPAPRHRSLDTSYATTFADAPRLAGAGGVPKGTLLPARLLLPADPANPGPVTAEVTKDVRAGDGSIAVPHGATLACSSQPAQGARVRLTCDTLTAGGRSLTVDLIALGTDQRPGIPVDSSDPASANQVANTANTAIDTAAGVGARLVGSDITGALAGGALRAGQDFARRPNVSQAALSAAPKGTAFFAYVNTAF